MEEKLYRSEALRLSQEICKRLPIEKYMKEVGVNLLPTSNPDRIRCCCPIHKETSPSFMIYTNNNSFFCYGCKAGGSVVWFAKLFNNWGWIQTVKNLALKLGISFDITDSDIAERIFEEYFDQSNKQQAIRLSNKIEYDAIGINAHISNLGRQLQLKYGNMFQVAHKIESIFKVADEIFISENNGHIKKLNDTLVPTMEKYKHDLDGISDKLEAVANRNKTCTACWLQHKCKQRVVGEGDFLSRVMFLGEAPGKEEDDAGRPFVGLSGKLLRKTIQNCGYDDKDIWIDNVSDCRPPNNEFQPKEAKQCKLLWLNERIRIIKPKAIMLFGGNASKTFLNNETFPITQNVGRFDILEYEGLSIEVWYNFHPSYLLRSGGEAGNNYQVFKQTIANFLDKHIKK